MPHDAEPARLLPGEALASDLIDDAEMWATVYEELYGFLRRSPRGCRNSTLERFRERRDYWRRRRAELGDTEPA